MDTPVLRGIAGVCVMLAALLVVGCPQEAPGPEETGFLPVRTEEGVNLNDAGPWRYILHVRAKDTLNETRAGLLFKDGRPIRGRTFGEPISTPWGKMRWFREPPHPIRIKPPYNFGWLHRTTYGQPVD